MITFGTDLRVEIGQDHDQKRAGYRIKKLVLRMTNQHQALLSSRYAG